MGPSFASFGPTVSFTRMPSRKAKLRETDTVIGRSSMGKGNDNDRYVVPRPGQGWAVVKEDHERASAIRRTQHEAIDRAKQITGNLGGGEVRVQNRHGKFREGERGKKD